MRNRGTLKRSRFSHKDRTRDGVRLIVVQTIIVSGPLRIVLADSLGGQIGGQYRAAARAGIQTMIDCAIECLAS